MPEVEITHLRISAKVREKLLEKHDLDAEDVRAAVENVRGLRGKWHNHPKRGLRFRVWTAVGDTGCELVLYPAEGFPATVWNLGSAYPEDS